MAWRQFISAQSIKMNARGPAAKLDVEVSADVGIDEWQAVVDCCQYATFFHTPSWFAAFSRTYPEYEIVTKRFVYADGTIAILPLIERRARFGSHKTYLAGPAGCYGGWISASDLHAGHVAAIVDWAVRNLPSLTWRVNPLDDRAPVLDALATTPDTTEMLFLSDFKDETALRRNYKQRARKEINKAARAGLAVKSAEVWSEWARYFELYHAALHRWGDKASSRYPIELFRNLFELNSDRIKLWLVLDQDNIVGGNLNFYHNRHSVEWHAAFDDRFFGTGARNFLVDRVIVDAMQHGYGCYDFNPSGRHEGTRKFKQAFGTSQVATNLIRFDQTPSAVKLFRRLVRLTK